MKTLRSLNPVLLNIIFNFLFIVGIFVVLLFGTESWAQKRVDLDELEIRGELYSDNRLVIVGRDRNELRNFVRFRTNYRKEIIEVLPVPAPGVK